MKKEKKSKAKTKAPRLDRATKELMLTDKERDQIAEEFRDQKTAEGHIYLLNDMFVKKPELQNMLFEPLSVFMYMLSMSRPMQASGTLKGTMPNRDEMISTVIEGMSSQFNYYRALESLIPVMRRAKVKREKRALMWAVGEVFQSMRQNTQPHQCMVARTVAASSVARAMTVQEQTNQLLSGGEPYNYDYRNLLEPEKTGEEWDRLTSMVGRDILSIHGFASLEAMECFELAQKPFGLRFPHIIHYPVLASLSKKNLIVTPGDSEQKDEVSQQERMEILVESMITDFVSRPVIRTVREIVNSVKASLFGEIEQERLQRLMNAVTLSTSILTMSNPFLMRLYEQSGEKADQLNPEDEMSDIIEIKSSPDNSRAYRIYGEKLFEKQDMEGARRVLLRAKVLLNEKDEELEARIRDLEEELEEKYAPEWDLILLEEPSEAA